MDEPKIIVAARCLRQYEPASVIMVRLPVSYHRILLEAAADRKELTPAWSLNKECVSRLLVGEDERIAEALRGHGFPTPPPPATTRFEQAVPIEPDLLRT